MVRFGIVGAGGIAKKFARDLAFVENAIITAVATSSKEKLEEYKQYYQADFAFSSYEDMAKSDAIDAVYIATPHSFHYEQALLFMKHNKHVLIEKPITVNLKEYEELKKVALEHNVLMMEAMWTYYLPAVIRAQELVKDGSFGKLLEAQIWFGQQLIDDYPKERRLLNPALAGGSILDIAVYPFSLYRLFQESPIKTMTAEAEFTSTGVDADCTVEITEEKGAKIHIRSSIKYGLFDFAKLTYENGVIELHEFHGCSSISVNGVREEIPYEGEGFVHEIRAFADDIDDNILEDPVMTYQQSTDSMTILDKTRELIGLKFPFEQ